MLNNFKTIVGALAVLSLQGCIGSKIRVKDSNVDAPFPSLHSVPERPVEDKASEASTSVVDIQNQGQSLEENKNPLQETPDENEKLRRQFGL